MQRNINSSNFNSTPSNIVVNKRQKSFGKPLTIITVIILILIIIFLLLRKPQSTNYSNLNKQNLTLKQLNNEIKYLTYNNKSKVITFPSQKVKSIYIKQPIYVNKIYNTNHQAFFNGTGNQASTLIKIDESGNLIFQPIQIDKSQVNNIITNIVASNGLTGGGDSGQVIIQHANTSNQPSVFYTNKYISGIGLDQFGHVTKITASPLPQIPQITYYWQQVQGLNNTIMPTTNYNNVYIPQKLDINFNDVNSFINSNTSLAVNGNVGIGTDNADLQLTLDNSSGIIAKSPSNINTPLNSAGNGVKFIWYPTKRAFRAGEITTNNSNYWDQNNIGNFSVAFGKDSLVTGNYSFALGENIQNTGEYSTTIGNNLITNADHNYLIGSSINTTGQFNLIFGQNLISRASNTILFGLGNLIDSNADNSVIIGKNNNINQNSINNFIFGTSNLIKNNATWNSVWGMNNTVEINSQYSFVFGENNSVGQNSHSFIFGDKNSLSDNADYSFVFGYQSVATHPHNIAVGYNAQSINANTISIGDNTHAQGQNSTAVGYHASSIGNNSLALGYSTAINENSIAIGNTSATNKFSISLGTSNDNVGDYAITIGTNVKAEDTDDSNAENAIAIGRNTTAQDDSIAIGYNAAAKKYSSIAIGTYSQAEDEAIALDGRAMAQQSIAISGDAYNPRSLAILGETQADDSIALGLGGATFGQYSIAIGEDSNADNIASIAIGYNSNANDLNTIAIGREADASGEDSVAYGYGAATEGENATSIGSYSYAEGDYSIALGNAGSSGEGAIAIGNDADSEGDNSIALGTEATTIGENTIAIGKETYIEADNAMALGLGIRNTVYQSIVLGSYNEDIGGDQFDWTDTDPLLIIGNGQDDTNRSNAMVILKNGNTGILTNVPTHALQVGEAGDGTDAIANAWNTFSDIRFKKDIKPINNALDIVNQLNGVYYTWKKSNKESIGFIAQEVKPILPYVVTQDRRGYLGIDYSKFTPLLTNAIKELNTKVGENTHGLQNINVLLTGQQDNLDDQLVQNMNNLASFFTWTNKYITLTKKLVVKAKVIFNKIVRFTNKVIFTGKVIFRKIVTFKGDSYFYKAPTFMDADMAGKAVINKNHDKINVRFFKPYKQAPIINVTHVGNQPIAFTVVNITKTGFTIKLSQPAIQDEQFNWMAIYAPNAQTTQNITPTPSTTPSPTPTGTPTPTNAPTPTSTPTPTATPTPSNTPTPTGTPTPTPTSTPTPTNTPTPSPTLTTSP